ncbi:hypothetical protein BHYA_0231g00060 [Botrytis hyacinthi]|uniref:Uncharacterized protein n=1 Tax=Botrytis hyacinthi TaxID=278943 RepID=A0A4Z1G9N7_9HELO|nr:hypothetical protein BHYA_0231g00060 [Botrytis hyacinthi]
MPNQNNHSNNKAVDGKQLPPIRLPGESMQQSYDRIARGARGLREDPDSLLAHSIRRPWGNSAEHLHVHSNHQGNNSTSCFEITANPHYRSGTSSSGQHSPSAQQTSIGSGAVTSNGNASRQSNPEAQRDNSGWNTASPHAQNTGTSTWNGRDQPGGENFKSDDSGGYQ